MDEAVALHLEAAEGVQAPHLEEEARPALHTKRKKGERGGNMWRVCEKKKIGLGKGLLENTQPRRGLFLLTCTAPATKWASIGCAHTTVSVPGSGVSVCVCPPFAPSRSSHLSPVSSAHLAHTGTPSPKPEPPQISPMT